MSGIDQRSKSLGNAIAAGLMAHPRPIFLAEKSLGSGPWSIAQNCQQSLRADDTARKTHSG